MILTDKILLIFILLIAKILSTQQHDGKQKKPDKEPVEIKEEKTLTKIGFAGFY